MADIAIAPRTRTQVTDRLNHTFTPYAAATVALGISPLGATPFPDSSSASIPYSTAAPLIGGSSGQLIQSKVGTNIGAKLLERTLSDLQLGANTTYTVSLYVNCPTGTANPQLFVNGPGVSAAVRSVANATKNTWFRISVTFTTSTSGGLISVYLFWDSAGAVNNYTLFDALQIDDGPTAQPFFSGEGPLAPDPDHFFKWLGTRYNSLSAQYHFDGSEVTYPTLIENGFHAGKDNGNILHRTLQNQLVVVRRLATLSIGSLVLFYTTRSEAFRQYSLFDRLDDFQLIDNQNPETQMFFAVSGRVLIDQVPEAPLRWRVTVPFEQTS